MKISGKEISVSAGPDSDIVNITDEVCAFVEDSGCKAGLVNIFSIGSTASITTIEFEPNLVKDMRDKLEEFAPKEQETRHGKTWGDDNGFSHIRATMMGPGISVPLHEGHLLLGTWQQIVAINHDNRRRKRRIFVQVIGM